GAASFRWRRLRGGLEAGFESALKLDLPLSRLLLKHGFLRLRCPVENLKLGLFVLQHADLGTDSCLQIETGLLVPGRPNGGDQALDGSEPGARVRQRLAGERLTQGVPLARRLN